MLRIQAGHDCTWGPHEFFLLFKKKIGIEEKDFDPMLPFDWEIKFYDRDFKEFFEPILLQPVPIKRRIIWNNLKKKSKSQ